MLCYIKLQLVRYINQFNSEVKLTLSLCVPAIYIVIKSQPNETQQQTHLISEFILTTINKGNCKFKTNDEFSYCAKLPTVNCTIPYCQHIQCGTKSKEDFVNNNYIIV